MEEQLAILAGVVAGIWALLLWLSIVVWTYRDIRDRSRDSSLHMLSVFVVLMFFPAFNIPGLALYLMLRPRDTLEEAYARSLEEEALLRELGDEGSCPSCRRLTDKEFHYCPSCQTQLKDQCSKCQRLLSFSWVGCPYCGTARAGAAPAMAQQAPYEQTPQPEYEQDERYQPTGATPEAEGSRYQH